MTTFLSKIASGSVLLLALACVSVPGLARADSDPFVGEIWATGVYAFCPYNSLSAEGQLLPISSYQALFSLFGTTYGGDGKTTFALPDLRGRVPLGVGVGAGLSPTPWGYRRGQEGVVLTEANLAPHHHGVAANNQDGNLAGPTGTLLAAAPTGGTGNETIYSDQPANRQMSAQMIAPQGQNMPAPVLDPTLAVRYCVAVEGVYPMRP